MTLTIEDIRFIDSYLENSGVEYADIRMEMVDHVATEVEIQMASDQHSFYKAFKKYMIQHKKELLRANKRFKKTAEKKVWLILGKQVIQPKVFLFAAIIYFVLTGLQKAFNIAEYLIYLPATLLFLCAIFYGVYARFKKVRFSGMERAGAVFCLISQILLFCAGPWDTVFDFSLNSNANCIYNAIVITLIITFIKVFQDFRKEYSKFPMLDFV